MSVLVPGTYKFSSDKNSINPTWFIMPYHTSYVVRAHIPFDIEVEVDITFCKVIPAHLLHSKHLTGICAFNHSCGMIDRTNYLTIFIVGNNVCGYRPI